MVATVGGVEFIINCHIFPVLAAKELVFITLLFYPAVGAKKNDMTKEIKLESPPEAPSLFLFCRRLSFIERSLSQRL